MIDRDPWLATARGCMERAAQLDPERASSLEATRLLTATAQALALVSIATTLHEINAQLGVTR